MDCWIPYAGIEEGPEISGGQRSDCTASDKELDKT